MIRPLTLLCLVGAAGAGLHVYQTKHSVSLLDRELRGIARSIEEAETRTQGLHAEWAWLTEQERLRGLAQRHLALEPMQPAQFVRMAEAERRLPAATAYAGPTALFAAREPATPADTAVVRLLAPRRPAVPAESTVQVARAMPPAVLAIAVASPLTAPIIAPTVAASSHAPAATAAATPAVEARTAVAAAPRPAEPRAVEARTLETRQNWVDAARSGAVPRLPPRPLARQSAEVAALPPIAAPSTPRPMVTQVAAAAAPRLPVAPPAPARAAPSALPRAAEAAVPLGSMLGNALGGRLSLPPPVAFSPANAATYPGAGLR